MQSLVDHVKQAAIVNVWANPHIDKQFIFKPARLTRANGVRGNMRTPFVTIDMPAIDKRFVIYEIGQLSPKLLGLDGNYMEWVRLDDVCKRQRMHIFGYLDNLILPNHTIYVKRNTNRSLLFAVDATVNQYHLLKPNAFFLRFYSNAWYNTTAGQPITASDYYGGTLGVNMTLPELLTEWNRMRSLSTGHTFAFVNGRMRDILSATVITDGDTIEIVHDGSVYGFYDVSIDDVGSFYSKLDKDRKLLMMTPDDKVGRFHFQDDIEFFICNRKSKDSVNYVEGVYYPREKHGDVRQVTQQDWSIRSEKVTAIILEQEGELAYTGSFVRVFLRNATGPTANIQNANYTHDLFLLPYEERKRLMTGSGAVLNEWRADTLESSYYNKWISDYVRDLGPIADVFSYYGVNTYTEQFKMQPVTGLFDMPPIMQDGGLVIEFSGAGNINAVNVLTGADFSTVYSASPGTFSIHAIPGTPVTTAFGLDQPSSFASDIQSAWDEIFMFKDSANRWRIGERGIDYDFNGNRVSWKSMYITNERARRDASRFLYRTTTITRDQIGLPIPLFEDGSTTDTGHGFKRYELWLNGKRLVDGVDYLVSFPNVTVRNYEYLVNGEDTAELILIGHGVPPMSNAQHWGFVVEGLVSHDDVFNLHLFRNKALYCDGVKVDMDYAAFGEGYHGSKNTTGKLPATVREGALFTVLDPVNHMAQSDWLALGTNMADALNRSAEIERFLTKFFPPTGHADTVTIPHKHSVVSILLRKLLEDLRTGILKITRLDLSDVAVGVLLNPYAEYISKDAHNLPVNVGFIQIRGHGYTTKVTLTQAEYNFFVRVNALYLDNRVVLSDFFMF